MSGPRAPGGTLLTGGLGINPSTLNTGANTLLGAGGTFYPNSNMF